MRWRPQATWANTKGRRPFHRFMDVGDCMARVYEWARGIEWGPIALAETGGCHDGVPQLGS